MKVPFVCFECAMKDGSVEIEEIDFLDLHDGVLYEGKCKKGHTTRTTLDQFKHEVLFELAIQGIIDGYYREAVTNFTSALERLYETFLKITLIRNVKDYDKIEVAWKKVSSQSERQLGAFIFQYLSVFGELPQMLSNKQVSFRNDVIHKGKTPTNEETIKYGNNILKIIRSIEANLKENFKNEIELYAETLRVQAIGGKHDEVLHLALGTQINLTQDYSQKSTKNIEEMVKEYNGTWLRKKTHNNMLQPIFGHCLLWLC